MKVEVQVPVSTIQLGDTVIADSWARGRVHTVASVGYVMRNPAVVMTSGVVLPVPAGPLCNVGYVTVREEEY